jgi:hypothetical protein
MVLQEIPVGKTKSSEDFELPVECCNDGRMVLKFSDVLVVFHR